MDAAVDPFEVARLADRMRRRVLSCMPGVRVRDMTGGWVSGHEGRSGEESPSSNWNRAHFLAAGAPLRVGPCRRASTRNGSSRI